MISKRHLSVVIILLLLITITFPQCTTGFSGPLRVFITYPEEDYYIGDDVTVQMHVFKDGARIDPDKITFKLGHSNRYIVTSRVSVGLYESTFKILTTDVDDDWLPFQTGVHFGSENDMDYGHIWIEGIRELFINLIVPNIVGETVVPGQEVDFIIKVTCLNQFVDPDPGSLNVSVRGEEGPLYEELSVVMKAQGIYEGSYRIPESIQDDTYLKFWAEASYSQSNWTLSDVDTITVHVQLLYFWYHYIQVQETNSVVDLHVFHKDGARVANADIIFNYSYTDTENEYKFVWQNLTTNESGVARLEMDYPDIGSHRRFINGIGKVEKDGLSQDFIVLAPNFHNITPVYRPRDGFLVKLLSEQPIPLGTDAELRFLATVEGEPLANQRVCCYIEDHHKIHAFGNYSTDSDGTFTVTIPPLSPLTGWLWYHRINALFEVWLNGNLAISWLELRLSNWEDSRDYRNAKYYDTKLEVEELVPNYTYRVTLYSPGTDGIGEWPSIFWSVGPSDPDIDDWMNTSWVGWDSHRINPQIIWSEGAYSVTIEIPEFIPEDVPIEVSGSVMFLDQADDDGRRVTIEDLRAFAANKPPDVSIDSPQGGKTYKGVLEATGEASDDTAVIQVEVRIDGQQWQLAVGADEWSLPLDTSEYPEGSHTLEARSFDGMKYSDVEQVDFEVIHVKTKVAEEWPWIALIILLIISSFALLIYLVRRTA
jgi:hypothetical protein